MTPYCVVLFHCTAYTCNVYGPSFFALSGVVIIGPGTGPTILLGYHIYHFSSIVANCASEMLF